ncbi:MAG: four helix bundle protein, partial [Deltaproteobacteria bacterium]
RCYAAHFISKLTDCDGENSETDTWLDFACTCGYLSAEDHERLTQDSKKTGGMLGSMLKNPSAFIINADL